MIDVLAQSSNPDELLRSDIALREETLQAATRTMESARYVGTAYREWAIQKLGNTS